MLKNTFVSEKIPIRELCLWDENARFPDKYFNTEEQELIGYFAAKPDFKIREFIEEIVKDFDLPQIEKIVVWKDADSGRLTVLEGNRRVTAYKLLCNPNIISDASLSKYLEARKTEISIEDDFSLECLVTENKDEGFRYIDRKHANGNYEVNWQDTERAHYSVRRGNKNYVELLKIGVSKIIRRLDLPEEMKEQILGKGYVTTFFRIITSSAAKTEYGFEIDEGGNLSVKDADFQKKLKIIIFDVLKKQDFRGKPIDSRSLNKSDEKEGYIKSIKKEDIKKIDEEIKRNTTKDIFGENSIAISTKNKIKILPKSTNRKYLIPDGCLLRIEETKINNIYRELREDLLLDDSNKAVPNAVGVLFRVFLEISIDYFLEKEGVTLSKDTRLKGKITKCSEMLEGKAVADKKQLLNIRKVATDEHNILCIQNFHDYLHSYKSNPSSNDLKNKWDNLQEFF